MPSRSGKIDGCLGHGDGVVESASSGVGGRQRIEASRQTTSNNCKRVASILLLEELDRDLLGGRICNCALERQREFLLVELARHRDIRAADRDIPIDHVARCRDQLPDHRVGIDRRRHVEHRRVVRVRADRITRGRRRLDNRHHARPRPAQVGEFRRGHALPTEDAHICCRDRRAQTLETLRAARQGPGPVRRAAKLFDKRSRQSRQPAFRIESPSARHVIFSILLEPDTETARAEIIFERHKLNALVRATNRDFPIAQR